MIEPTDLSLVPKDAPEPQMRWIHLRAAGIDLSFRCSQEQEREIVSFVLEKVTPIMP